jgi:virginiamycin B lyase
MWLSACTPAPTLSPIPAEPATAPTLATWTDDFNDALASGWSWVDEDPTHWNLIDAHGALRIITQGQSLYSADKPTNLLSRDAPAGDFEIVTKVTFDPKNNFQQAAILIYQDEDNFVLLNRGFCEREGCPGSGIFLDNESNGEIDFSKSSPGTSSSLQTTWLRLHRKGTKYIAFYSGDGQKWEELGRVENPMTPTKVGLTANNANDDPSVPQIPADFDSFTIQGITLSTDTSETPKPSAPLLLEHLVPTPNAHPGGIAFGPDGAVWFVETPANKIGRISSDGHFTEYPVPTAHAIDAEVGLAGFIGVGPDGALWFNEDLAKKLGRITTEGQIKEYDLPNEIWPLKAFIAAPDGALWATSQGINGIVKLTTDGQVAAQYTMPTPNSGLAGIVLGPDQALWFAEARANQIGRLTLDGVLTEYSLPDKNSFPLLITVGPDQALWFTMFKASKIGRITIDGKLTSFAAGMTPVGITTGKDGAIWFTGPESIGRLTTDGELSQLQIQTQGGTPYYITMGEGSLWFTEKFGNKIGQIQLPSL